MDKRRSARIFLASLGLGVGAALAYLGALGFLGAMGALTLGALCALGAYVCTVLLQRSDSGLHRGLAWLLSWPALLALTYFGTGTAVLALELEAPELGHINKRPLQFVALIPDPSDKHPKRFSGTYTLGLYGKEDSAHVELGTLDASVSDVRYELADAEDALEVTLQEVEPDLAQRPAFRFDRLRNKSKVNVRLTANYSGEEPVELVHVVLVSRTGERDFLWKATRHFHRRYR